MSSGDFCTQPVERYLFYSFRLKMGIPMFLFYSICFYAVNGRHFQVKILTSPHKKGVSACAEN